MTDPMDIQNLAKAASEQLKEVLSKDIIVQQQALIEELEAERDALAEKLADMYRLHLRRGPAWDHDPTRAVMDRVRETLAARATLAELKGED